jgi:7-cyano-7-deazaguanine reductase
MSENPLGEQIPNPSKYDPGILYPIPRWAARSLLEIDKHLRMHGLDHWHAYELSWLNGSGKPQAAIGEFYFSSDSENIVESKSLKLYLNSFNQEKFDSPEKLAEIIENDLSAVSQSAAKVFVQPLGQLYETPFQTRIGRSIDGLDVVIKNYQPDPTLLQSEDDVVFDEQLFSDLFKSNCPVTNQPDWASFEIQYTGTKINEASLLSYICSFRDHQGYHEECAERIYRDIMQVCRPIELSIALNFLRRGGLDINVYRSSEPQGMEVVKSRFIRQ